MILLILEKNKIEFKLEWAVISRATRRAVEAATCALRLEMCDNCNFMDYFCVIIKIIHEILVFDLWIERNVYKPSKS